MDFRKPNRSILWQILTVLGTPLLLTAWAFARSDDPAGTAAGCAVCGTFLFIPVFILVLDIALLIWVARDAKSRGMDGAILWMLLVMFTSVIGLVIYLLARPQGNTIPCPNCQNKKLQTSVKCPHCGA